ncbi:hypothetical protein BDV10DRAFT_186536 [Aspergillus recurvatus]
MPPAAKPGRLASFLRPWSMIWLSICLHWEALTKAIRQNGFTAVGPQRLRQIHDAASAKLLSITSSGFITFEDTTIVPSLVRAASGVVLELGPGPGNQIHRFDTSAAQYIYGVEPNGHFEEDIDAKLRKHGLTDRYKLLVCGIEDSDVLRGEGISEGTLDAVLCIQILCAVKDPKNVMKEVWKLLRPGEKCKLSFYGNGGEIWESTTYETAAEYVAAVARDPSATGLQHFLGDRRSIRDIADNFAQVYGKTPQLERLGSLDDLYSTKQATFNKDPSNIFAYLAMFYQYYCTNGQAYLKPELDNRKYPEVNPVSFKEFLQGHQMEELSDAYQNAGSDV